MNKISNTSGHNLSKEELIEQGRWSCASNPTFRYLSFSVVSIVTFASLFGNILIIVSICSFRNLFKGRIYKLIGNLAIADIVLATGLILQQIEFIFNAVGLEQDILFCAFKICLIALSLNNSSLTLLFMSFDRFLAISYPMIHFIKSKETRRTVAVLAVVWIVSVILGFAPALASVKSYKKNQVVCKLGATVPEVLFLFAAGFVMFLIIVNVTLGILVVIKVKRNASGSTPSRQQSMRSKSRLLIKVFVLYALSWLPFVIFTFLHTFESSEEEQIKFSCYREYSALLGFCNSGMNWVVYGLGNIKFRKTFKALLCRSDINSNNV